MRVAEQTDVDVLLKSTKQQLVAGLIWLLKGGGDDDRCIPSGVILINRQEHERLELTVVQENV